MAKDLEARNMRFSDSKLCSKKEPFVINRENGLFFKVPKAKSLHFVHN